MVTIVTHLGKSHIDITLTLVTLLSQTVHVPPPHTPLNAVTGAHSDPPPLHTVSRSAFWVRV